MITKIINKFSHLFSQLSSFLCLDTKNLLMKDAAGVEGGPSLVFAPGLMGDLLNVLYRASGIPSASSTMMPRKIPHTLMHRVS